MASLKQVTSQASINHLRVEEKLYEAKHAVCRLPRENYYEELLAVIRRPGWTTGAERIYFAAMIDLILVYTENLTDLHQQLMAASRAVQTN
ncbi:hypothetical protein [Tunturiibacter gelidiferens]|uniref:hypothetical protein n=1 Tax=Tunturiibacter gelidiferens TaxID=3069689 RepID=UPI003D9B1444